MMNGAQITESMYHRT